MNIWIFNHYACDPSLPGGTRHYDFGKQLIKSGHKVTIFSSSFHYLLHQETRLRPGERCKTEDVNGVNFVWIRTAPYQRNDWRRVRNMIEFTLRSYWLGRQLPKLIGASPDVLIGSSVHLFTPLAAYWVAKRFRVPFVMEVRDLWPQTIVEVGKLSDSHPVIKLLRIIERFLYRKAQRIIVLGPQMVDYIASQGVRRDKIVWIPNGVDLSRFEVPSVPSQKAKFNVMYLGAHGEVNALDTIVHAADIIQKKGHIEDIKFILVGDGPEKPKLVDEAKKMGLTNIEFRDPVPKKDVPKVLSEADVLIAIMEPKFYIYGGSLNKLSDYMAAAKPVICAVSSPYNPIERAQCGLTVKQDPLAIVDAVMKLYHMSQGEREKLGLRGRRYAEKYHDIRKLAQRMEQVLLEVLN